MKTNKLYIGLGIAVIAVAAMFLLQGAGPFGSSRAYFSNDVAGLSQARASEIVALKNDDTYSLVASYVAKNINGTEYRMLAYNGSIPGPLIKVAQGSEVTINFKNDTDMPTLLHSHGVRMDNRFDGSQTSQVPIPPGDSFSYKLKFPDAGVYWYHPHVREDLQQELGLYGNYLVVPSAGEYWSPVNREVPLFLDDILIEDGQIRLSKQEADHTLMGRFGNVMLVNGDDDYTLNVKKGEVIRLYITNAANARPFNFAIEGTRMKLVGADGGAYEMESLADSVVLGPSERAIVEVLFDKVGTYAIQNKTPHKTYTLGNVTVSNEQVTESYAAQFAMLRSHKETVTSIESFRSVLDKAPDKRIALIVDMMGGMMSNTGGHMMGGVPEGGIEWEDTNTQMMNEMSNANMVKWHIVDQDTGKKDMDIDWAFKKDEPIKIRIENDPNSMHPMQHPIHFHGQRFLVVARDNVRQAHLVWKDTVLVKAGETVDIVLDPSNPGVWMAHCHISEHLESGMMLTFRVQ